jgi:hypothetical protein
VSLPPAERDLDRRQIDPPARRVDPLDLHDHRVAERLFALLDRAHIANPVKNAIYDAVLAAPTPADAALELVAMDLHPPLLGAVTELLLAR